MSPPASRTTPLQACSQAEAHPGQTAARLRMDLDTALAPARPPPTSRTISLWGRSHPAPASGIARRLACGRAATHLLHHLLVGLQHPAEVARLAVGCVEGRGAGMAGLRQSRPVAGTRALWGKWPPAAGRCTEPGSPHPR